MKSFYKDISYLLTRKQKKELVILSFFMLIGMIMEAGGIGILIPALSFLLDLNLESHAFYVKYIIPIFGHISAARLIFYGLIFVFIFFLVKSIFLIYFSYRQSNFVNNLSRDLSKELYSGYLQIPYVFLLQKNSSELHRNIQVEILHFGGICLSALTLATEITTIFGICILFIYMEPLGGISVILFFGIFTFFFNKITNSRITQWGYKRQEYEVLSNKHLAEGLGGVKQIKLSQNETFFINRFMSPVIGKGKTNTKIQVLSAVPRLYLELLAVVGISIIFLTTIIQQKPFTNLIPLFGIFMAAAFRLIPSINKIINCIQNISFAKPILQVLIREFNFVRNKKEEEKTVNAEVLFSTFENEIRLVKVFYKYPQTESTILADINLTIKCGECIGIIGKTGSGKSTLINLLVGLLKPDSGKIFIGDSDINVILKTWQKLIGYVPQSIYLTDDTIRNNIAFGIPEDRIDERKLHDAILKAQLSDFIKKLPRGLETEIGERGVRLSGGEQQRIAIARALYNDPPILVLDEATSSLDNATEKEFMLAVSALQGKKTIIIIAHRLTTVKNCDKVYELINGKLLNV
jgi:ABC-type multidrug transport system fused ATPase/permease subunit